MWHAFVASVFEWINLLFPLCRDFNFIKIAMAPKSHRKPAAAVVKSAAMKVMKTTKARIVGVHPKLTMKKTLKDGKSMKAKAGVHPKLTMKKTLEDDIVTVKSGTPTQYKNYARVVRNVLSAEGWIKAPPVASQRLCDVLRVAVKSGYDKEQEVTLTFQPMVSCKYEVVRMPVSAPDRRAGMILKRILEASIFSAVLRLEC